MINMYGVMTHNEESCVNEDTVMPHAMATAIENMKKATWAEVSTRHQYRAYPSLILNVPGLLHFDAEANMAAITAVTIIIEAISITGIFPGNSQIYINTW